jgi:CubicO group peptidase (beta-lactamase class C family)
MIAARRCLAMLIALAVLRPVAVPAQAPPLSGLDAWIESAMRDWEVPGLAVAVVRNDSIILLRGYGVTRLGGEERVDGHTLFAVASTTKAMTTAALGMLVDEGRIDWDDPVSRHLPAFQLHDPYVTRELTVRDLVTHRSGVARSDELWLAAPFDRDEVLRRARHVSRASGFRTEYGYNNIMFIAAGELVAAVSGTSWDDFLQQRLFTPLGMTRTSTRTAAVGAAPNVAASHVRADGRVVAVPRRDYDNIGGAGAAFSSAHDMAQWMRLHLNGGEINGTRLLSAAVMSELHTPQVVIRGDTVSARMFPDTHFRAYGLGCFLQDYHGRKVVHHSGSLNFMRTQVMMVPSERIGVVAMANLSSSTLQLAVAYRAIDALLGLQPRDWSAEYLELAQRAEERSAVQAREAEAERVQGTQPSLGLAQYAGTYDSSSHGEIGLVLEDGRLVLRYSPDYIADVEHWHYDTFRAHWRNTGYGRAFLTFALDARGRVQTLRVDGIGEFRRVAERATTAGSDPR